MALVDGVVRHCVRHEPCSKRSPFGQEKPITWYIAWAFRISCCFPGNSGNLTARYTIIVNTSSVCSSRRWTPVAPYYVRKKVFFLSNVKSLNIEIRAHVKRSRQSSACYKTGGNTSMGVYQTLVGRNFVGYKKRETIQCVILSFGSFDSILLPLSSFQFAGKTNKIFIIFCYFRSISQFLFVPR